MKKLSVLLALFFYSSISSVAQPATLKISAEAGILVYMDGEYVGITNMDQGGLQIKNLKADKYSIVFAKKGFGSVEDKIKLSPGEELLYVLPPMEPDQKNNTSEPPLLTEQQNNDILDSIARGNDSSVIDGAAAEKLIFMVVDEMPQYPGGEMAMYQYLAENIRYPREAKKNGVSGRVLVTFVIERDGSVTEVRVLRGIGGGCDEEAVRVVKAMPRWTPGIQKGKPVRVQYNIPIKFTLSSSNNK
jgi:TonB family protein